MQTDRRTDRRTYGWKAAMLPGRQAGRQASGNGSSSSKRKCLTGSVHVCVCECMDVYVTYARATGTSDNWQNTTERQPSQPGAD